MGAWGAIVMGFFGGVFASLTMYRHWQIDGLLLGLPFLLSFIIILLAVYTIRLPGEGMQPSRQAERVIMWSSIGEGLGLFIAANLVQNLHLPHLLLPAMALVVGLHFLPIAHAASFRPLYLLGGCLVAFALPGLLLGLPAVAAMAGIMAALCLWFAAGMAIVRDWRFKVSRQIAPQPDLAA